MKRFYGILAVLALTATPSHCDIMDYARGRAGTALKNAFRIHCTPEIYRSHPLESLRELYLTEDGHIIDGITNSFLTADQSEISYVIPPQWMSVSTLESNKVSMDLHNLVLTEATIAVDRGTLPFAPISTSDKLYGGAAIGYSMFRNDLIQAIEPHQDLKGNIARSIFYVTTLYPVNLWTDWGSFFFDNNPYPTLSTEAINLYLKWHREDPVDNDELLRCKEICLVQGNVNPFVTNPEIAEYLWGNLIGKPYGVESSKKPEPLKHTYSKHSDPIINLASPYLPTDTKWWIDKKEVSGEVATSTLSDGKHEIRFTTSKSCGKLIITINP